MNREPFLKLLEDKGMTFQRAKYVRGFPRLSGALKDESIAAEIIGYPQKVRAVNLICKWNADDEIKASLASMCDVLELVFPGARKEIQDSIDVTKIQAGFSEIIATSGNGRRNFIVQCQKITDEITVVFSSFNML